VQAEQRGLAMGRRATVRDQKRRLCDLANNNSAFDLKQPHMHPWTLAYLAGHAT